MVIVPEPCLSHILTPKMEFLWCSSYSEHHAQCLQLLRVPMGGSDRSSGSNSEQLCQLCPLCHLCPKVMQVAFSQNKLYRMKQNLFIYLFLDSDSVNYCSQFSWTLWSKTEGTQSPDWSCELLSSLPLSEIVEESRGLDGDASAYNTKQQMTPNESHWLPFPVSTKAKTSLFPNVQDFE